MVTALGVFVLTSKVALVAPAGTLTTDGTTAAPAGSVAKDTATPSPGAAIFKVTVPCKEWPSVTLAELRLIDDNSNGESWAETDRATPRQINNERRMVPSIRIRLFDLATSGPFANMWMIAEILPSPGTGMLSAHLST